jgi:hypothetical protein
MVGELLTIAAPAFAFLGTVLRMWDSLAEADHAGQFVPRNSREELHRLHLFFTMLERRQHAATTDRELYYLRTAQGWFFLAVGSSLATVIAAGSAFTDW